MLIYYFATEVLATSGSEERCVVAPYWALYCIYYGIALVSMSDR